MTLRHSDLFIWCDPSMVKRTLIRQSMIFPTLRPAVNSVKEVESSGLEIACHCVSFLYIWLLDQDSPLLDTPDMKQTSSFLVKTELPKVYICFLCLKLCHFLYLFVTKTRNLPNFRERPTCYVATVNFSGCVWEGNLSNSVSTKAGRECCNVIVSADEEELSVRQIVCWKVMNFRLILCNMPDGVQYDRLLKTTLWGKWVKPC